MRAYKRIRIFPERDLRATRLELAVIDTRTMQRLRDIRQLGQSFVAFPTAEHSRFSHVLGVLYWATKMLSYLKENYFARPLPEPSHPGNEKLLEDANSVLKRTILRGYAGEQIAGLEVTWFEQLIRLAALLHDVTHLPYGHTLEDQAELLPRHDEDPERIVRVFGGLAKEIEDSPHLKSPEHAELRRALPRLLEQCQVLYLFGFIQRHGNEDVDWTRWQSIKDKLNEEFLPYLALVYDIVNNTICADLLDYLQRDSLFVGMPWSPDKVLFSHLKILTGPRPRNFHLCAGHGQFWRLGVAVGRDKLRHDVVTAVLGLLRARYDVTEKVYYHHTKCAADAMLEKVIRSGGVSIQSNEILEQGLGDEGLLLELWHRLQEKPESRRILERLRSRRFYKAVYRLRKASDWSAKTAHAVERCRTPVGRTEVEQEIAQECNLQTEQIVVSCLPKEMQLKEAEALVEWTDGEILPLSELPESKNYLHEVTYLTQRYPHLWSLTVYFDEEIATHASVLESACERLFDRRNDPLLAQYVRRRYPVGFALKHRMEDILQESEVSAVQDLHVAYGGGSPTEEKDVGEVAVDHIEKQIAKKKATTKRHRREAGERTDSTGPLFKDKPEH